MSTWRTKGAWEATRCPYLRSGGVEKPCALRPGEGQLASLISSSSWPEDSGVVMASRILELEDLIANDGVPPNLSFSASSVWASRSFLYLPLLRSLFHLA